MGGRDRVSQLWGTIGRARTKGKDVVKCGGHREVRARVKDRLKCEGQRGMRTRLIDGLKCEDIWRRPGYGIK